MKNKKLSAETIRRLRAVARQIVLTPEQYDQTSCSVRDECGAPACLLGWAVRLFRKTSVKYPSSNAYVGLYEAGARALKLPVNKTVLGSAEDPAAAGAAYRLFEPGAWPDRFSGKYFTAMGRDLKAAAAVKRIEHFIATDGAE